eukprot:9793002-Alexandrium_andersonii.AAC.1
MVCDSKLAVSAISEPIGCSKNPKQTVCSKPQKPRAPKCKSGGWAAVSRCMSLHAARRRMPHATNARQLW